ncbi:MAG: class I SAM-dependent methyltransferase [Thermoanaerobaculia bacterium]
MDDRRDQEAAFHDAWARSERVEEVPVRAAFEAPTALENRFIVARMGDLAGRRLLDVGCGLGESAVYFALRGAEVTATDLAPEMVDFTRRLARHHGVEVTAEVSPAEELAGPAESFDLVYAANVLHHVGSKESFFRQLHRVLVPGGRFFTWDPLTYNPVIWIYRRLATAVRTEDEHPLSFRDARLAGRFFTGVGHREFQIATLAIFLKYFLVDRVHPNQDRYWKRILHETPASLRWWFPLERLDRILTRLPLVRRLGWNMVLWGRK